MATDGRSLPASSVLLFDDESWSSLRPLTWLRPVGDLRVGVLTQAERWSTYLNQPVSYLTQDYLSEAYKAVLTADNLLINAAALVTPALVQLLRRLPQGRTLMQGGRILAARLDRRRSCTYRTASNGQVSLDYDLRDVEDIDFAVQWLDRPHDLFLHAQASIWLDFALLTDHQVSAEISASNTVIGPSDSVFAAKGVRVEACIFNTQEGPIYLGENVQVMEGSILRGPIALGPNTLVKMGAKLYGGTSTGPWTRVGGEVSNTVFQGYCNKGHDGYVGNAVIGRWCNLGADTNASNLKNNYAPVRAFNYHTERFEDTGLQFCGLVMGDHAKCAINTQFNTGSVVGVGASVVQTGFPPTHLADFSWASNATYQLDKFLEMVERVYERRGLKLSQLERKVFYTVFDRTAHLRPWERSSMEASYA